MKGSEQKLVSLILVLCVSDPSCRDRSKTLPGYLYPLKFLPASDWPYGHTGYCAKDGKVCILLVRLSETGWLNFQAASCGRTSVQSCAVHFAEPSLLKKLQKSCVTKKRRPSETILFHEQNWI